MSVFSAPENMSQHLHEVMEGCYDIPSLKFDKPPVILDLGANVGSFAIWASRRWPGAKISCYEPDPGNFALLSDNVRNEICACSMAAVSDHRGKGILYPGIHNCGEASLKPDLPATEVRSVEDRGISVDLISGEDLPQADILKLDTEGCEWEILSTYRYLDYVSAVMFEWHSAEDRDRIEKLLLERGLGCVEDRRTQFADRGLMKFKRGVQSGVNSKDVSLLIACPCYGGQTYWTHNNSILELILHLKNLGVEMELHYLPNESLIPRARNRFGTMMVNGKYTHLLFLDVDIGFSAVDIVSMIALDKDIIALPYAAKDIGYEKIIKAVKKGCTDVESLRRCHGRPIINVDRPQTFNLTEPVQFPQLGTGVMLIKKKVFEQMAKDPTREYKLMPGEINGAGDIAYDFFRIGVNPETRFYDSEDYRFTLDARKEGFETWLWPNAVTTHTGNHTFIFDANVQAQLGLDLTMNSGETVKD